jgi:tetratricopeptide (TPR) repeat protein
MADEPVSARREPITARVGRWARRHRTLVSGAAVLLTATTVALSVGTFLLTRANRRTEQKRQEAEQNYTLARDAVNRYFTRVSEDRLLNEPQMERLRKDLLETAREFYQKFVDQRKGDRQARADLANSHLFLSHIDKLVGEIPDAILHAEQGQALIAELVAEHPRDPRYLASLAWSFDRLARSYAFGDQTIKAEAAYREAIRLVESLAAEHHEIAIDRWTLGDNYFTLGELYRKTIRVSDAEAAYLQALEIWEKLAADHPEDIRPRRDVGRVYLVLGDLDYKTDRIARSEPFQLKALKIFERVLLRPSTADLGETGGRVPRDSQFSAVFGRNSPRSRRRPSQSRPESGGQRGTPQGD